ncbi:hypothetical protein KC19_10G171100 [Ceratodon purpureus]|uniref:Uncharacterized protein n=1 Tax=Ceratodon purpureus TaxID=3225 RepID=A0A8T0GTL9_CERPU|nr:hypothetical protein KC19_10G171100 [Ceratodon purpureus]
MCVLLLGLFVISLNSGMGTNLSSAQQLEIGICRTCTLYAHSSCYPLGSRAHYAILF